MKSSLSRAAKPVRGFNQIMIKSFSVGGREETYIYLWLIHVVDWQKATQHCKAIILQLKINKLREEKKSHGAGYCLDPWVPESHPAWVSSLL